MESIILPRWRRTTKKKPSHWLPNIACNSSAFYHRKFRSWKNNVLWTVFVANGLWTRLHDDNRRLISLFLQSKQLNLGKNPFSPAICGRQTCRFRKQKTEEDFFSVRNKASHFPGTSTFSRFRESAKACYVNGCCEFYEENLVETG